ncbi:HNH endonuclease [Vibrio splendidus]|uniref:HNH endonuclease n=1 Tax=Vibrio splendidus TaxID=29497 RepID=UPI0011B85049|nr:HNH endonuclease [Vibrio splendidus]
MSDSFIGGINKAMLSSNPWKSSHASSFKKYIKNLVSERQGNYCCYCKRDFNKETERVKHIEHILPKSKFPAYTFDVTNLALSCVRCNSDRKSDDISFLAINMDFYKKKWSKKVYSSELYRFIHPNLENIDYHLDVKVFTFDNRVYYKYKCLTEKAIYHYDYFDLKFFEFESISKNQGISDKYKYGTSRELIDRLFKRY